MPVIKSAEKRARQNIKHYRRNLQIKQRVKGDVRALIDAIAKGNAKAIAERLNKAQSTVDKAAKNKVIHKNKAARIKSSLAKKAASPAKQTTTKTSSAATKSKASATKAEAKAKSSSTTKKPSPKTVKKTTKK